LKSNNNENEYIINLIIKITFMSMIQTNLYELIITLDQAFPFLQEYSFTDLYFSLSKSYL
jgi:hypothetical protein